MEKNFVLETGAGDTFQQVAKNAKQITSKPFFHLNVQFDFNGIICIVSPETNLDWLYRDYSNSWTMGWKEVGPKCLEQYPPEVQKELDEKKAARAIERQNQQEQQDKEEAEQKAALDDKIKGVILLIRPDKKEKYAEYVKTNSDGGYSQAVIEYSEAWAKLMQVAIGNGEKDVKDVADETQKGLGFFGITGFQYGCAVKGLSHFWAFGEELRRWHNKEYGHEGKGVVNPAVLSISIKD